MARATSLLADMVTDSFRMTFRTSAVIALLSYFTCLYELDLKCRLCTSMY